MLTRPLLHESSVAPGIMPDPVEGVIVQLVPLETDGGYDLPKDC